MKIFFMKILKANIQLKHENILSEYFDGKYSPEA